MYIKTNLKKIITTTNNSQPNSSQLKLFHNNKIKQLYENILKTK